MEGFSAGLVDDANIFEWEVVIVGPPDTPYEGNNLTLVPKRVINIQRKIGGLFRAILKFSPEYPNKYVVK